MAGTARVGCSGWMYDDWRGRFYPERLPKREWFEHYAGRFDTVELNATFYRLPAASTVGAWAQAAPPGFVYSVKLGAFGSHRMKLRDAGRWLPNHLERFRALGRHTGPTLVQLPPRWRRNPERLDEFLGHVPRGTRWAIEVRDRSWLHADVYEVLERHGAALCIHDLLSRHPWRLTTDWTYVRFHGPNAVEDAYGGRYGTRRLRDVAGRLRDWLADGIDVYAYFDNDRGAHAPEDARRLRARLHR